MCISSLETKIFFEEGRFAKKKNLKKYEYFFIVKDHLKELIGVDITTIPGINENTAVKIISEIGTDINRWPSAKHFCAWIGLCSSTMISEGHVLRGRNRSCTNRAGIFLGLAANTLYRSNTLYGTFLRKMKFHKVFAQAVQTLAHKMARTLYSMMKSKSEYVELGSDYYDKIDREKTLKNLKKTST